MREREVYVQFDPKNGLFSLWDSPAPGRQPLMMTYHDNGRISAEDQGGCAHHNTVEGVDDDGNLVEPPYDQCVDCGATFH
jgi:hypothetical protein